MTQALVLSFTTFIPRIKTHTLAENIATENSAAQTFHFKQGSGF